MPELVYIAGFAVTFVLAFPRMIASWWEAQGRGKPFEFGGGVWVLLGTTGIAAIWPISLLAMLGGMVVQSYANRPSDADSASPEAVQE